jgi:hypothetical protein
VGAGQPGGNSIITNGNVITTITPGTQYGALKTDGTTYVRTLSSSATQTNVTLPSGFTNAIIIVPTGVTLRSNSVTSRALYITGTSVTNLKIIVNGAILGKGGFGGSEAFAPEPGGDAIKLDNFICNTLTVDCTYGYVAGGGGGGGWAVWNVGDTYAMYGGGGAGGGNSGYAGSSQNIALGATTVGASGSNGTTFYNACESAYYTSGGGGGLIVPGTTVSLGTKNTADPFPGIGGSGGGSGAARKSTTSSTTFTNNGGGFNVIGGTQINGVGRATGGGGGGWGSTGGDGKTQIATIQAGNSGGYAIDTNIGTPVYVINPANIAGVIY